MCRFACLLLIASCAANGDARAEVRHCEQLRDRLVENQLAVTTGVDKAAHRDALRSALGADFVERCTQTMTEDEVDCVLKASSESAIRNCKRRGEP